MRGVEGVEVLRGVAAPASSSLSLESTDVDTETFGTFSLDDTDVYGEGEGDAKGEGRGVACSDSSAVAKDKAELARDSERGGRILVNDTNVDDSVELGSVGTAGEEVKDPAVNSGGISKPGGADGPSTMAGSAADIMFWLLEPPSELCDADSGSDGGTCSLTPLLLLLSGASSSSTVSGCSLCESDLGSPLPVISSKSGGGTLGSSTLDELAANATACSPYGTPNRWNASRDEISLTCSGVGPVLGYVNSVRTSV